MRARAASLLLIAAVACTTGPGPDPSAFPICRAKSTISRGQRIPDCSFEGASGQPALRLADLKGKPAVLNFWATWCGACKREMPAIQAVHVAWGDRITFVGMDLLGVQGETREDADDYAEVRGVTYRLAFDPDAQLYGHFGNRLNPIAPLTVVVTAEGRVADLHFGELTERSLRALIEDAVGEV